MGLDVRVYGNIQIAKNEDNFDFKAFVIDENWRYKIKNLEIGKFYKGDVIFRGVGYPYSTHGRFRESLIKLIDKSELLDNNGQILWEELTSETPFYDFIDFADNEGCLDWEVSETIYKDFAKFHEKAKNELGEINLIRYATWMETFELAKNNRGVVVFT